MPHYHIRWSTKEALDWEAFGSPEEAEAAAQQLVRSGETYTIVEVDEGCPRCWKPSNLKAPRKKEFDPNRKYPWQKAILDAFAERRPEHLIRKISSAQSAISARLTGLTSSDLHEQAAIREALRNLRQLLPEQPRPNLEYPDWQRPVLEAVECDLYELSEKIRTAELAIRRRLKDSRSLSRAEMQALHDALRTLDALMRTAPKRERERASDDRDKIA